jgi:hypothetical protein
MTSQLMKSLHYTNYQTRHRTPNRAFKFKSFYLIKWSMQRVTIKVLQHISLVHLFYIIV